MFGVVHLIGIATQLIAGQRGLESRGLLPEQFALFNKLTAVIVCLANIGRYAAAVVFRRQLAHRRHRN